ncbi:SDR family oxidoreductase [Janibacter terrae]|uniref:SDR family oxidoreductase n=1 Tax=Janibacter terrae TaxID=103817 RepID=UPI0008325E8A|nr:SDR family oxidoreductase [Janibacter terrae]MBA4084011.1 short chain dehydrogenase [Kytococcus sp.]HCE61208.1 short chain dehydrogenase [Janibacter terrae]
MTFTTLITGASSGLGAEMARQFAALGHDLALTARRTDRLDALRAEIAVAHPDRRVETYALDVTDDAAVTRVFEQAKGDLGRLDRVVVNAGLGKGAPYGKGSHYANRETIETNVLGAAMQTEAAMAIFREQRAGHLVLISSVTALRGMPKSMTTYGASKAFLAALGEGIRSEMMGKPDLDIDVTVLFPGYIRSEMNEKVEQKTKFMVDTETGVRAMVAAIEARKAKALVPAKPWVAVGGAMRVLPLSVVRRLL